MDAVDTDWDQGRRIRMNRGRQEEIKTDCWTFAWRAINRLGIKMSVLLVTLVYIRRAGSFLKIAKQTWDPDKLFLGAIVLASKVGHSIYCAEVHFLTTYSTVHR